MGLFLLLLRLDEFDFYENRLQHILFCSQDGV